MTHTNEARTLGDYPVLADPTGNTLFWVEHTVGNTANSYSLSYSTLVTAVTAGVGNNTLLKSGNLSGLANTEIARTNLGLGTAATYDANAFVFANAVANTSGTLLANNNLSDVANTTAARTNLGLGDLAASNANTVSLSAFAVPSGDLVINGHKLSNVATPAAATDAATKGYVDGLFATGTVTSSVPILFSQTWSNSSVTFTGMQIDITDTASASFSMPMDVRVASVSKFSVTKEGVVTAANRFNAQGLTMAYNGLATTMSFRGAGDVLLVGDGAGILSLRNSTNAQTFNIYNTYTDASNYERLTLNWSTNIAYVGMEKAGTGSQRDLVIRSSTNSVSLRLGSDAYAGFANNAGTSWIWKVDSSTGHFLAGTDNTYDIGASGATRPRNIYIAGSSTVAGTSYAYNFISNTNATTGGVFLGTNNDVILGRYASHVLRHGPADNDVVTSALISISNASPAVITTSSTLTYSPGTPVKFTTTGALPTGLTVGTQYYILTVLSANTFTVSTSVGGTAVNTSGAGSGTHSMVVGPISQYIRPMGAVAGTDIIGAPMFIQGSAGTGAGAGGSLIFQVATAGSTGTTQNSYRTALTIDHTRLATFSHVVNASKMAIGSTVSMNNGTFNLSSISTLGWSSDVTEYGTKDVYLYRDAAGALALRNSTNAQKIRVYNTYTDSSNGEWLNVGVSVLNGAQFGIEAALNGTGSGRDLYLGTQGGNSLYLYTGNTTRWQVNSSGHFIASSDNSYDIGASGANRPRNIYVAASINTGAAITSATNLICGANYGFVWNGRSTLGSAVDGNIELYNQAGTSFGRLSFGGTTASFPALKRSTTTLQARLADDSAYTFMDTKLLLQTGATPSSASDTGTTGEVRWDASYIYVCTASNTWKRAAIATW